MLNNLNSRLRSFSLNLDALNPLQNESDGRKYSLIDQEINQVLKPRLSFTSFQSNRAKRGSIADDTELLCQNEESDDSATNEPSKSDHPTIIVQSADGTILPDIESELYDDVNLDQPSQNREEDLKIFHPEFQDTDALWPDIQTNDMEFQVLHTNEKDFNDLNNNTPRRKSRSLSTYSRFSFTSQRKIRPELLQDESPYKALGELIIPCLVAGFGNVATGVILAMVQTWEVFENVPQLNILVPALLGLKGNVEMTLASRLSTHANLGDLDDPIERNRMIIGNMALVQCQASTVGFIAPMIALAVSYISPTEGSDLTIHEAILLMAGSVITANLANLLLGSLMCTVVTLSRRFKINPDNIATPIAASFGDLTTMLFIAYISKFLFRIIHMPWIQIAILIALLSVIPYLASTASKQDCTRRLLITGWFPICGAMLIQITGGLIMEHALNNFSKLAAFQPVVNGVGGNLAAIQTSRISTYLHCCGQKECISDDDINVCAYPGKVFFEKLKVHSIMARLLLLYSIPCHILFVFLIKLAYNHFTMTPLFFTCYMVAAVIQVAILIQISYSLVHFLWKRGVNPDNSALPFLTAFGDLIGSALLAMAFVVMMLFNDVNAESESITISTDMTTTLGAYFFDDG
ncbi:solute carrier family 41 member 1-like isoform X2 [Brevipalpus obovatus]|uniref:solute carrier family 41 member 1-like isoform X2 n=1 Tax=Brevipalpus obovatus TaxID=246614 RepID=UPI003D9F117B